jgi:DnaJ like chaperone protein
MFSLIGGIAGYFITHSFFGSFLGLIIGSVIDSYLTKGKENEVFKQYRKTSSSSVGDFATMLMALSAAVMKADGKTLKSELDFVKSFFGVQFGARFTPDHLQALKQFLEGAEIPLEQICGDIKWRTQLDVRIQLMHYLFGLAKADGHVAKEEVDVIKRIANLLEIPNSDFESLKNMFYRNEDSDYKVLGIEKTATDDEVKKAYRQMAIRYHPDKVAQMGEEYVKGANEKFQKIQESYEAIKKSRAMN